MRFPIIPPGSETDVTRAQFSSLVKRDESMRGKRNICETGNKAPPNE